MANELKTFSMGLRSRCLHAGCLWVLTFLCECTACNMQGSVYFAGDESPSGVLYCRYISITINPLTDKYTLQDILMYHEIMSLHSMLQNTLLQLQITWCSTYSLSCHLSACGSKETHAPQTPLSSLDNVIGYRCHLRSVLGVHCIGLNTISHH